jgi:lysophospholipase L1-like esterase
MSHSRFLSPLVVVALLLLAACGGGGGTGPTPLPSPSPVGNPVASVVFYDENGDGKLDAGETIRVPDVEVVVGGRSAKSEKLTGRALVAGVPAGAQVATIRADTLPPFFAAGAAVSVEVPQAGGAPVLLPVTLPIGGNLPNVYMAFGDSITRGDGSASGGYPPMLQALLAAHFGGAVVNSRGADATNSFEGVERIKRQLRGSLPAYTLILYGTNDWHAPECQDNPRCPTVGNLREIVQAVKVFRSLPFLATILPVNPAVNPEGRNKWVSDVNDSIKAMAREEGAFVVDLNQAFVKQGDLTKLFSDGVHPNDDGYRVMANTFFEAIAHGR